MLNPSRLISIDLLVCESVPASSLYGVYDVLASVGIGWEAFVTGEPHAPRFRVRIVSTEKRPFKCASGVQISPDLTVDEADSADIVVVPGLTVSATEPLDKSQAPICDWLPPAAPSRRFRCIGEAARLDRNLFDKAWGRCGSTRCSDRNRSR